MVKTGGPLARGAPERRGVSWGVRYATDIPQHRTLQFVNRFCAFKSNNLVLALALQKPICIVMHMKQQQCNETNTFNYSAVESRLYV